MKFDLFIDPPLMNAAGSLGFVPDSRSPVDWSQFGAFVTNPVSLAVRSPARCAHYDPFPGGFLLHTGYPNPGLEAVIRQYAARWERSVQPVIVHLLVQDAERVAIMARRLESLGGLIAGLELGLSPQADARQAIDMLSATAGELPVILRLPLERAVELSKAIAAHPGINDTLVAFSLGPPRGALPVAHLGITHGRLYGPAIFPYALQVVQDVWKVGFPVIAAGGVYYPWQVEAMLDAGAMAVQLDAVLWRTGWGLDARLAT